MLETLTIHHSTSSDRLLSNLKHFSELKVLNLDSNKEITDAGLDHLKHVPELTVLNLSFTNVSDASLKRIESLEKLKLLQMRGTKVTRPAIKALRQKLPTCEIDHGLE